MKLPPIEECATIRACYEHEVRATSPHEASNARTILDTLLVKHGLKREHIPEVLAELEKDPKYATQRDFAASPDQHPDEMRINPVSLLLRHIEDYMFMPDPHARLAVALWIVHTHVFGWFMHSPRLPILSPVRRCGKTRLLKLIGATCAHPDLSGNTTCAAIYQTLAEAEATLLLEEGDNLRILQNKELQALLHDGFERGATIDRAGPGGHKRKYPIYAPVAIAAIGKNSLSLPLIDRSIIIAMKRRPRKAPRLKRFDNRDPVFDFSRRQIEYWKNSAVFNYDPVMPEQLDDRAWDCWRVLISIADALGYGQDARAAAIALCKGREQSDPVLMFLNGVRWVLGDAEAVTTKRLEAGLKELGFLWTGPLNTRDPRELKQHEIAGLLHRYFELTTKTIWPQGRGPGATSGKGYARTDLEPLFDSYCTIDEGEAPSGNVIRIGGDARAAR